MREVVEQLQRLSSDALHEKCTRVNSRRAYADWLMAACLLACERTQLFRKRECSSVVHYAVRHLKMDPQKASELLRAAYFLENLSKLSEAFRTGQIGWGKVRALKSVMTIETQDDWLAYALRHSVAELERAVAMNPTEWKRRAQAATLAARRTSSGGNTGDLFSEARYSPAAETEPEGVDTMGVAGHNQSAASDTKSQEGPSMPISPGAAPPRAECRDGTPVSTPVGLSLDAAPDGPGAFGSPSMSPGQNSEADLSDTSPGRAVPTGGGR